MEGFNNAWASYGAGKAYSFCDQNFLSRSTMIYLKDLVGQLRDTVKEVGLNVQQAYFSRNNGNIELLMSTVSMGLYPDVGVRAMGASLFKTEKGRKAKVHPGSINAKGHGAYAKEGKASLEFVGYQDLVAMSPNSSTGQTTVGGATLAMLSTNPVSLFSLMLCCGSLSDITATGGKSIGKEADEDGDELAPTLDEDEALLSVDGWIIVKISRETAALVHAARHVLSCALDHSVNKPGTSLPLELQRGVDAIVNALTLEQQQVAPVSHAADTQDNYYKSQQAHAHSQQGRDENGAGGRRMRYVPGPPRK